MLEKFTMSPETGHDPYEITEGERGKLEKIIEEYPNTFTEVTDKEIDYVLSRYIEKQDLSPDIRASLRKTIEIMLDNKIQKDE